VASNFKQILKISLLVLLFGGILTYSFYRARDIIFGIPLSVEGITDGMSVKSPLVNISGEAPRAKRITVNDRDIGIAQDGSFTDVLLLPRGYTIISVKAYDKFDRVTEKVFRVVNTEPVPAVASPEPPAPAEEIPES
jgi:hypothetical protein